MLHRLLTLLTLFCALLQGAVAQIEVLVLDEANQPIGGATVSTFEDSSPSRNVTDTDGRCRLPLPPGARPIRVRVEHAGFFHNDTSRLAQAKLTLNLQRAVALDGVVRLKGATEGLANAEVRFVHPGCKTCEPELVHADSAGRFRCPSVPRGVELELHVSGPNVPRQRVVLGALVESELAARTVELDPGHLLRGRVIDFESGAALGGARVATVPGGLNEARAAADGRFELRVVADSFRQLIRVDVSAAEHCRLGVVLAASDLAEGKELRCPLPRFTALEGTVLDAAGAPVSGAEVFVREDVNWLMKRRARGPVEPRIPLDELPLAWSVTSGEANASALTDVNGRFRFDRVCPWMTDFLVHSQHPIAGGLQLEVPAALGPGATLELRLEPQRAEPGGTLSGNVTLNGVPVQGVLAWKGATRSGKIAADPRGRYSSKGIEPGKVELVLEVLQSPSVRLTGAEARESVELEVALDSELTHDFSVRRELARVRGRVVDPRGAPLAKLPVGAVDASNSARAQTHSDSDGRFELEVLAGAREWTVQVIRGPELHELPHVRVDGEAVLMTVPDLGRLRVRFFDARTQANLAPALVMWRAQGQKLLAPRNLVLEPQRDLAGWFEAEIPVGTFELGAWVTRAGYPPTAPRTIRVERDGRVEVEFALEEGRPLGIQLAADSARPASDESARLWVLEEAWWAQRDPRAERDISLSNVALPALAERYRALRFDENGRAQVPGLAPGRYRFVTSSPGDAVEPATFEFKGEERESLEIRWTRAP